ncbi:efflux RND transporter periplasmic adaptor subunit [Venenivibrio stagnispumantis]|uniref:HlyD family secretion protein/membrane fusion protein, macrolide-specific efflux system n=1 Tax=Venenivibrio stagnispumantis TaxID=407998 RepID=A0AA45WLT6_9AQUI|nr:efflux RND transporter periplasmic adaptor subunit [Venenivibrio stagnispumantis]MCW4573403.1 efflux RND transporter periplasmic adaptor subunit [Venenivibrio stagnispumantis]SMP12301.1 HlyD family secretion protein/membrane fusion protein, macrolide-specific efflux system [Venenivibrio stagnispumantis]
MKKLIYLIVIIIIGILIFGIYNKFFKNKEEIKVLETAVVKRENIINTIDATAIVQPQVNAYVKVGARATGTIVKMNVDIGDKVKKGQLIAIIDQRETLIDTQTAQKDYQKSLDTLYQIQETYPLRIKEAEKALEQAKANYNYAKWNLERQKSLIEKEYTTYQALEQAKRDYESAKASLEQAEKSLERVKKEYETQLRIAKEDVEIKKLNLTKNNVRTTYTEIYSPIDGIVSNVTAREGETVVAGLQVANLITILDPTKVEIQIYVDETDIGKIKEGQKVEYTADAYPGKKFEGVISKIYPEPVVKDNIVYYLAIVKAKEEDALFLKPQMTVYAKIITGEKQNALVVPNSAVKFEENNQVVYKVDGKKITKVKVKTGWITSEYTEILEGLKEGDIVATKLILPEAKH